MSNNGFFKAHDSDVGNHTASFLLIRLSVTENKQKRKLIGVTWVPVNYNIIKNLIN